MPDKLPAYFKEYLDERFGMVLGEIQAVKNDVAELKKTVSKSDKRINKLWTAILVVVIVLLFHFGQSENDIIKQEIYEGKMDLTPNLVRVRD